MSSIVRTVAPTTTPVTLDELKDKLRISGNEFDTELQVHLDGATDYCQEYQWAQFCTATFVERFDSFPCEFRPQRNPLRSVTSLAYVDSGGTTQTIVENTDYTVDIYSIPARVVPAYSKSWPASRGHINDVTLTYVAGYGGVDDVPDEVRLAILLKAARTYEHCEDGGAMDGVIHNLLDKRSFRVFY